PWAQVAIALRQGGKGGPRKGEGYGGRGDERNGAKRRTEIGAERFKNGGTGMGLRRQHDRVSLDRGAIRQLHAVAPPDHGFAHQLNLGAEEDRGAGQPGGEGLSHLSPPSLYL